MYFFNVYPRLLQESACLKHHPRISNNESLVFPASLAFTFLSVQMFVTTLSNLETRCPSNLLPAIPHITHANLVSNHCRVTRHFPIGFTIPLSLGDMKACLLFTGDGRVLPGLGRPLRQARRQPQQGR